MHLDILGSAPPASLSVNLSPPFFLLTPPRLTFLILPPPRHHFLKKSVLAKLLRLNLTTGWNFTHWHVSAMMADRHHVLTVVLKSFKVDWNSCWWLNACPSDLRLSSVGVLFSVEVMSSHFALKHYCPCFFSAACGALTFRLLSVWSGDMGNDQHSHLYKLILKKRELSSLYL